MKSNAAPGGNAFYLQHFLKVVHLSLPVLDLWVNLEDFIQFHRLEFSVKGYAQVLENTV